MEMRMKRKRTECWGVIVLICFSSVACASDDPKLLRQQIAELSRAGKHAEAIPIAEKLLIESEKWEKWHVGPETLYVPNALITLAWLNNEIGEYGKAESLAQRALAIYERALGAQHRNVAEALSVLGEALARR
jgi:tetratricopeptide (TPR) repeat protein